MMLSRSSSGNGARANQIPAGDFACVITGFIPPREWGKNKKMFMTICVEEVTDDVSQRGRQANILLEWDPSTNDLVDGFTGKARLGSICDACQITDEQVDTSQLLAQALWIRFEANARGMVWDKKYWPIWREDFQRVIEYLEAQHPELATS